MTRTDRMRRRYGAATVMAIALTTAVTACSTGTTGNPAAPAPSTGSQVTGMQPGPTTSSAPCTDRVQCSPDGAAVAGLDTLFSYRATDADPAGAAATRAAALLTEKYRSEVDGTWSMLLPITGSTWTRWRAEKATITATTRLTPDEHPPDTATRAYRVAELTQTVAPTPEPITPQTLFVVLEAGGAAGWRIAAITTNT